MQTSKRSSGNVHSVYIFLRGQRIARTQVQFMNTEHRLQVYIVGPFGQPVNEHFSKTKCRKIKLD